MTEQLGHYELVRHLATGGMAEIYVARQSGPGGFDRELAIKKILPHLAREERFISMFLDEARIASRLRHPNIVQIYELGEESGEYFIAMEYIEGCDLADLLDKAEDRAIEVPIAMSVRIIADVLAALDYAHEFQEGGEPLHIVHRDVSPHNILIGRDGIIKLVDFGIAHAVVRHAKTETGLVKGKLSYMSPEQIEQEPLDRRADIFAAGVLLYELLAGQTPFGRELAAVNAILTAEMPDPREHRPDIPDELVPILSRALAKKPEDRYQSAQKMLEDLESVLRAFDKYVSAKHVAQFADRLLNDEPIEGYDDVSQAIPRSLSRQAFKEVHQDLATPPGLRPTRSPTPIGLDDTLDADHASHLDLELPELSFESDDDLPARDDRDSASEATATAAATTASDAGETADEESGQVDSDSDPSRTRYAWLGVAALVVLAGVGLALGALSTDGESVADARAAEVDEPPVEPAARSEPTQSPEPIPTVIELETQIVDLDDEDLLADDGFYFDEDDVHLAELEQWVTEMSPERVDQMLAANFERSDADYLWSVRAPELAEDFSDPPGPINPGDPLAPKLLGLETLDEEIVKPKPRVRRVKRRPANRVASAPGAKPVRQAAKKAKPAPKKVMKTAPKRKAPKKKKKKREDLRIIDRAVPY